MAASHRTTNELILDLKAADPGGLKIVKITSSKDEWINQGEEIDIIGGVGAPVGANTVLIELDV